MIKVVFFNDGDQLLTKNGVRPPLEVGIYDLDNGSQIVLERADLAFYVEKNVIKVLKNRWGPTGRLMGTVDLGILLRNLALQKEENDKSSYER